MNEARATSHWAVAAAGVTLIATAIVVAAREDFTIRDAVNPGSGSPPENEVLVVSLAALGALTVFAWLRSRTADRVGGRRRDE